MTREPSHERPFADFETAFQFITSRTNYELGAGTRRFTPHLVAIQELMDHFGHPQLAAPTVHITGTKGKGSTSTFLATLLRAAGRRVGLYTSPHLVHPLERIQLDGRALGGDRFASQVGRLAQALDRIPHGADASFFDLMTAAAFLEFRDAAIDFGVIEVGMGGRLDSTNVVSPRVTVITNVDLDHTRVLGETHDAIAREKAGILKAGTPLVCGMRPADPGANVIRRAALERDVPVRWYGEDFELERDLGGGRYGFRTWFGRVTCQLPQDVPYLARNLSVAIAVLGILAETEPDLAPEPLLDRSARDLAVPGRCQWLAGEPRILLDGAHNEFAYRGLAEALERTDGRPVPMVIASMEDKLRPGVFKPLAPHVDIAFATRASDNPRAAPAKDVRAALERDGIRSIPVEGPAQALDHALRHARQRGGRTYVLVTGSLYLVAEVLTLRHGESPSDGS
ncbi:MAG: bifunctional folylpolyglutamate synthase/dihydrofolate synthase [Planctomycetes bacterium]|nr:bifunctional folylpolyglutamate synthase/dihydrofolate synthase [Planctomycetota bacterium]MCB9890924.1 bifunctional folylpolyglutamate synthase/dihydrofolate synthase [Planctomycetota bacterium]